MAGNSESAPDVTALVKRLTDWMDGQSVCYASVLMGEAVTTITAQAHRIETLKSALSECYRLVEPVAASDSAEWQAAHAVEAVRRQAADVARLEAERAQQDEYRKACEAMIREHATAADIFQPGGRFHARANLLLGRSAVVDGIAWLVKELDAAETRAREATAEGWKQALEACARSLEAGADAGGRQTETGRVLVVSADTFREHAKRLAAEGRR